MLSGNRSIRMKGAELLQLFIMCTDQSKFIHQRMKRLSTHSGTENILSSLQREVGLKNNKYN